MALPPPALNDIVQVGIESRIFGQRVLLTHFYRFTTASGSTPIDQIISQFIQALSPGDNNDLITPYAACLPNNQTITSLSAQKIYPTRYSRQAVGINQPGTVASAATASNVSGTITFQDGFAGRSHRATKHVGTVPPSFQSGGLLTGGYKDSLNDLAGAMSTVVSSGNGYILSPIIYHKDADGPANKGTLITAWTVGDTLRVMRRRTVGLGE